MQWNDQQDVEDTTTTCAGHQGMKGKMQQQQREYPQHVNSMLCAQGAESPLRQLKNWVQPGPCWGHSQCAISPYTGHSLEGVTTS